MSVSVILAYYLGPKLNTCNAKLNYDGIQEYFKNQIVV